MEKIKIHDKEIEILSISQKGNLLLIEFLEDQNIYNEDLSEIEILTAGGVPCATLAGFTTIYKDDGNMAILSNDGSVYTILVQTVDSNGFIIETKNIAPNMVTEFDIAEPIADFFWTPKWDFGSLQWVEGGTEPEPMPREPTEIEVLKQKLYDVGQIAADNSQSQQELLELLIEMGVI